ncbi:aldehyde dehydrogenase family protein [Petroclostridium sp. X23]|uniref:aldehyde dehydrogenase family protein n=1 Tax=Petroclostridium sp. X23 TaxID=3045146 RepID=UPI0024AE2EAF|nr:aldehyde dehydrogenase family protein [Petroclostridium sp. X23]WHH61008.1 aldehyde dehydrogenase family protein [Petroclostridium sp. X23]
MNSEMNAQEYVAGLMQRARKAQEIAESYTQEKVDKLVKALAWTAVQEGNAQEISKMAVEESRLGNYQGKYTKLQKKIRGLLRDIKDEKSVGVIERDEKKGLIKIAKPVGVIGALVPCTNPEATPFAKAMCAVKGRNAIVFSPHPRTKKTNKRIVDMMRETLKKYGAPEDLIVTVEDPTLEISNEVMKQCDLIVATGGSPMVRAAYSSGTPAYGVGTGNAVIIVDETADIKDAAHKIMLSKTFDYATSCSAENSLIIHESIYEEMIQALKEEGGYLVSAQEKEKLQNALWVDGHLNPKIIAQPAQTIAQAAGIELSEDRKFIMVEEQGIGKDYPFSGEKLSVVVALYKYRTFEEAIDKVNAITDYQGKGHSCGIHTTNDDRMIELGSKTKVSRIMVRQPQCYGNTGDWVNGMPFTMTLGCGTWGGNITTENIGWKHFINITWIACPIQAVIPSDEELFGDIMKN